MVSRKWYQIEQPTLHGLLLIQDKNGLSNTEKMSAIVRNQRLDKIYTDRVLFDFRKIGIMGADVQKDEDGNTYAKLSLNPDMLKRIIEAEGENIPTQLNYFILTTAHEYLHLAQRTNPKAGALNDYTKGKTARELLAHHFMLFPNTTGALDFSDFVVGKTNVFNELPNEFSKAYYAHNVQSYIIRFSDEERSQYQSYIDQIDSLIGKLVEKGWAFPDASTDVVETGKRFYEANQNKIKELRNE